MRETNRKNAFLAVETPTCTLPISSRIPGGRGSSRRARLADSRGMSGAFGRNDERWRQSLRPKKKSKTSPGVTSPVFPDKFSLKELLSKKTLGGGGLLSGARSSAVCKRGTTADIQKALKRGDLHSLLALQSKPSGKTLFKKIEKNSNKEQKPKRKNKDDGSG